ncbi:Core-2/I-Branching enzyme [Bacillus mobilis]|uniref:Peptide O-xylosyltransferase n=4 Tax=Bacillus cereus group TaxID=86661 RepID=A0A1Y6AAB4_9BACI|nr:beta-1,6-N-acetylglucosaminyltransferase [Bacillus mobilis]SME32087.1 Core-2/I-Branching enzyme [Bacillus mobilis]
MNECKGMESHLTEFSGLFSKNCIENTTVPHTAYILQVHKNPDQVNGFIDQIISEEQADVFVHIDKKTHNELCRKILNNPNVEVLDENIDVKWGDISQVDATILLLKKVLDKQKSYDFVCLRSGQDLLVKNGFRDFLLNNKNKIFMTATHIERSNSDVAFQNISWPKVARKQYNVFHPFRVFRRIIMRLYGWGFNIFPNPYKLPEEFSLYHGSSWFCIPLNIARYIIDFLERNEWYYDAFKNALCPDEWFFQTIIMNSEYKSQVVNNNLIYLRWGQTFKNRNHPITFTLEDINSIESSDQYFARKFDQNFDNSVIEYFINRIKI